MRVGGAQDARIFWWWWWGGGGSAVGGGVASWQAGTIRFPRPYLLFGLLGLRLILIKATLFRQQSVREGEIERQKRQKEREREKGGERQREMRESDGGGRDGEEQKERGFGGGEQVLPAVGSQPEECEVIGEAASDRNQEHTHTHTHIPYRRMYSHLRHCQDMHQNQRASQEARGKSGSKVRSAAANIYSGAAVLSKHYASEPLHN